MNLDLCVELRTLFNRAKLLTVAATSSTLRPYSFIDKVDEIQLGPSAFLLVQNGIDMYK